MRLLMRSGRLSRACMIQQLSMDTGSTWDFMHQCLRYSLAPIPDKDTDKLKTLSVKTISRHITQLYVVPALVEGVILCYAFTSPGHFPM